VLLEVVRGHFGEHGEVDQKLSALSQDAFDVDLASHLEDNLATNTKTQSGASVVLVLVLSQLREIDEQILNALL
jgi:hypothetical protein